MKLCARCQKQLPLKAFHPKGVNRYQAHCKLCSYEYQREWYKINRRKQIDKNTKRKDRYRAMGHISWVKQLLYTMARSRNITITAEERAILAKKLEKDLLHTPYCPYTGEKLYPGINTALDHKNPISRYPKQALNYKNFQWVSKRYNVAKNDLTDDEFMILCKKISKLNK